MVALNETNTVRAVSPIAEVAQPATGRCARVIRNTAELKDLRGAWDAFQCHPFVELDFYLTILRARGPNVRPFVIAMTDDDNVAAILVARLEKAPREMRFGYRTFTCGHLRRLIVPHGGLIGNWNREMYQLAAETLSASLSKHEADVLELAGLPIASPLRSAIRGARPRFGISVYGPIQEHWTMTLPQAGQDPVSRLGKRARANTARERRVFERDFANQFEFRRFVAQSEVPELVEACEAVACTTYHRRLGFGFFGNDEMRSRLMLEAKRDRLRAYVLYIHHKPAAFWTCTLSGPNLSLDYTAFSPEYRNYDVGKITFLYLLEDIRDNTAAHTADFGSGEGFLKRVFGDAVEQESSLYVFSNAFHNVAWALAVRACTAIDRSARRLLRATGQIDKIKRIWRRQSFSQNGRDILTHIASRHSTRKGHLL